MARFCSWRLFVVYILSLVSFFWVRQGSAQEGDGPPAPISPDPEIAAKKAVLTELTEQAEGKRSEKIALDEQIGKLNQQIGTLKDELKTVQGDKTRAEKIQQEISALEKAQNEKQGAFNALSVDLANLDGKIKVKEARVVELEDTLRGYTDKGASMIDNLIVVYVEGNPVFSGGAWYQDLHDVSEGCMIEVRLHPAMRQKGYGTLKAVSIEEIALVEGATGRKLDIPGEKFDLQRDPLIIPRTDICDRNRESLDNWTDLRLRVKFQSRKNRYEADFYIRYVRSFAQFDVGITTYFAGGVLEETLSKTAFAIFPALKLGARFNLPTDNNRDFYLQPNLLAGGGFVVVGGSKTGAEATDPTEAEKDAKVLAPFVGASIAVGKFVEAGYAYDPLNKAHLVIVSPGAFLSTSIFTQ